MFRKKPEPKSINSDPIGYSIAFPEVSDWEMHHGSIVYAPTKGQEPNWFHRQMQRIVLGFVWKKRKQ